MLLFQEDAELLFHERLIPHLRDLRSEDFRQLVDDVLACEPTDTPLLGFSLMMVRLASCMTCTADSYRAMNGCTACATKTISGFRGTDSELRGLWQQACEDVENWKVRGVPPADS